MSIATIIAYIFAAFVIIFGIIKPLIGAAKAISVKNTKMFGQYVVTSIIGIVILYFIITYFLS
jgi:hypothetical protein